MGRVIARRSVLSDNNSSIERERITTIAINILYEAINDFILTPDRSVISTGIKLIEQYPTFTIAHA
jgi:hypothetical protein